MRLAILTSGYLPVLDGVTISVHERLRRLSAWGHEILVVAPDYAGTERFYPDWSRHVGKVLPGVTVRGVPSGPLLGMEWERNPVPRAARTLDRFLNEFRPEIIHADEPERQAAGYLRRPGLAYARRHGIPALAFYHTHFISYAPDYLVGIPRSLVRAAQWLAAGLLARIYNGYDRTLVSSANALGCVRAYGVGNAVLGSFNGVDCRRFHPGLRAAGYFGRAWGLPWVDGRFAIVFVGRLTPDKGWRLLMRVLPEVAHRLGDRLAVLVVGDGDMRGEIAAALTPLGSRLHFFGRLAPDRVAEVLANATLHVTGSEKESCGLTVLEAFACGTPVVGPRAGGVGEVLVDEVNGKLFPSGDGAALADLLCLLADQPGRLRRLGEGALAAREEMDWGKTTRNWLDVLQALVEAKGQERKRPVSSSGGGHRKKMSVGFRRAGGNEREAFIGPPPGDRRTISR